MSVVCIIIGLIIVAITPFKVTNFAKNIHNANDEKTKKQNLIYMIALYPVVILGFLLLIYGLKTLFNV